MPYIESLSEMKKILLLSLFVVIVVVAVTGCQGTSSSEMEATIQDAEMAVAGGDMISASSIASKLSAGKNLSGLSAEQLARLSLVYMQIADSVETEENISRATDLYRQAYIADAAAADSFYVNIDQDKLPFALMLSTLVNLMDGSSDNDFLNDSILQDSLWTNDM